VALPLSMALAIASGVPPQHGLYTAIVAGVAIAALGGSRVQVSGPTAAFVVVLAPIATQFGLGGLLLATLLAGVLLVGMGAARLGRFIEFVPYPVTTGFTAGIAVVIGALQLKDFLGLSVPRMPDHFLERLGAILAALPTTRGSDVMVGLSTLAVLMAWPRRWGRRLPAPLIALLAGAAVAAVMARAVPDFEVATIATRFSYEAGGELRAGIPRQPPLPVLPWNLPGPEGGRLALSFDLVRALAPSAFAIAMLGAIESLLSAVVADGMTGRKHDADAELTAQGIGNIVGPFFGGIAATGAIARTATAVRSGARSPLAAALHALVVLAAVLLAAPLLGHLPMASLAALLMVVAWNMSESEHVLHLVRSAPRSDAAVLLICFGLTVLFDMVVSVTAGVVIAALLFMRRMAEVSGVTLVGDRHPQLREPLPRGVVLYEVAGPLFFGAAQKALSVLSAVEGRPVRVVVLDVENVPAIDATGLVALESLVRRLNEAGVKVVLVGVEGQPLRALARAGWRNRKGRLRIFHSFERGIAVARSTVERNPPSRPPAAPEAPPAA
ncbi:MAG TPA: C4-dicarboxylic acid transporter DauA, partial [Vicinamibacteria bacterium]|nr:C4-dicarboxylic acid transporter DauA [Vicinamibacteria bacterium]